jgi:hypothetical protein
MFHPTRLRIILTVFALRLRNYFAQAVENNKAGRSGTLIE